MQTIGDRIKALRQSADMTTWDLALRTGIRDQTLRNWERGMTPADPLALRRVAEVFGVTVDYLIAGAAEANAE